MKPIALLLCFSVMAACQSMGGFPAVQGQRAFAPGNDGRSTGVDGLLVGHRLMEAGEYELALKAYLRAAAEDGMSVDVLSALGSANLALGRQGQAEALLRQAIDLDPNFVPALNNLGVVLMNRDQVPEARVVFQQAFAADSGQTDSIRENLRGAIALLEKPVYDSDKEAEVHTFSLVRRGHGEYALLSSL